MKVRQSISALHRVVSFILAAIIFNFSIDSQDPQPDSVAEDLSFNDIESIYEFVVESLLGFDNAVAEHDEHDQEDGGSFDFEKFDFACEEPLVSVTRSFTEIQKFTPVDFCENLHTQFYTVNSPPPKG